MKAVLLSLTYGFVLAAMSGCGTAPQTSQTNHEWFIIVDGKASSVESLREAAGEFQELVSSRACEGDVVHVIDASGHRLVSSTKVPAGDARRRLRNKEVVASMSKTRKLFLEETKSGSGGLNVPRLPATIRSLRTTDYDVRVILVGTPIYMSDVYEAWNMVDGIVPQPIALRQEGSPFAEAEAFPKGSKAAWIEPEDWGDSAYHRKGARLWWTLFFEQKGSHLSCFSTEAKVAFDPAAEQNLEALENVDTPNNLKQWHVDWTKTSKNQEEKPGKKPVSYEVPPEVATLIATATDDHDKTLLAINWTSDYANTDIDLWVKSAGSEEVLSFKRKQTTFGRLHRDVQKNGSLSNEEVGFDNWEVAEIEHDDLNKLVVWLNNFSARGNVKIRFVVVCAGQKNVATFMMNGIQEGRSGRERSESPWWVQVALKKLSNGKVVIEPLQTQLAEG